MMSPTLGACCMCVLAGQEREDTPLMHYDDDVITILVPIFIPRGDRGRSGELIAFPNRRPFRRLLAVNIVDKLISRTARHRSRAVDVAMGDADRHVVDMVPGHAYAFWGYRTYHGNMPCAPGLVRATLILQSGEAHPNSPVMRIIARRRERLITEWVRRMHAVPPR